MTLMRQTSFAAVLLLLTLLSHASMQLVFSLYVMKKFFGINNFSLWEKMPSDAQQRFINMCDITNEMWK